MHPNGYTKEDIKRILGSSWPTMPEGHETGNQLRRRKGREMREGKRPYPTYPANCLLYTSPSPRDVEEYRMPSSA